MAEINIISTIIEAISFVQEMSGEVKQEITDVTIPIQDLKGFDSQRGIETTIEIETRLNISLPDGLNLFVSKDGTRSLNLQEIVKQLLDILNPKGK
jgi:hypothetical protein